MDLDFFRRQRPVEPPLLPRADKLNEASRNRAKIVVERSAFADRDSHFGDCDFQLLIDSHNLIKRPLVQKVLFTELPLILSADKLIINMEIGDKVA